MENIKEHKFIVFGNYSANTLGQIRGLGEKGIFPIAVLIHKTSFRIDKCRYISELHSFENVEEGFHFIIKQYGEEKKKPFLYTDWDVIIGLFDANYNLIKEKFYFWNAGQQGRLKYYLSKANQIQLAKECGFNIPKTEVIKVGELPTSLSYPIFTKTTDSLSKGWKVNTYICKNERELIDSYKKMNVENILLQNYIEKKEELPIDGISINGGEEIVLLGRTVYYRLQQHSFGTYRYVEPYNNKEMENKIHNFIKKVHYTGPFQIEFIIDKEGTPYYLETNFRIAQQNYGYTQLGANIPYLYAIFSLSNRIIESEIKYIPKRKINIMHEFEDFKVSVLKRTIPVFKWLQDVYQSDCYSFYNKKDMLPFYYTLYSKILIFLKSIK